MHKLVNNEMLVMFAIKTKMRALRIKNNEKNLIDEKKAMMSKTRAIKMIKNKKIIKKTVE